MTIEASNMEQDMRHVFDNALQAISDVRDRTITFLASYSQQAKQLADLTQRFEELSKRMDAVVQEAQRTRQDLHSMIVERDKYKADAETHLALAQGYEKERDETRTELNNVRADRAQLQSDLSEAQRAKEQSDSLVSRLRSDLEWTQRERQDWRQKHDDALARSIKAEEELKQAQDRLSTLQNTFRSIFPDAPKVTELPGTAPGFHQEVTHTNVYSPPTPEPQSVGEGQGGVNERIDGQDPKPEETHKPWWDKKAAE